MKPTKQETKESDLLLEFCHLWEKYGGHISSPKEIQTLEVFIHWLFDGGRIGEEDKAEKLAAESSAAKAQVLDLKANLAAILDRDEARNLENWNLKKEVERSRQLASKLDLAEGVIRQQTLHLGAEDTAYEKALQREEDKTAELTEMLTELQAELQLLADGIGPWLQDS